MKTRLLPLALCVLGALGIGALVYLYFHSPYEQTVTICPIYQPKPRLSAPWVLALLAVWVVYGFGRNFF